MHTSLPHLMRPQWCALCSLFAIATSLKRAAKPDEGNRLLSRPWALVVWLWLVLSSTAWAQCFTPSTNYPMGTNPQSVVVMDVNRDGRPDIVTASSAGRENVSVRLGDGRGGFAQPTNYGSRFNSHGLALADLNKDGWPDLITTSPEIDKVTIRHANRGGGFNIEQHKSKVGSYPVDVTVWDVDGNNLPDIITANRNSNNVSVRLMGTVSIWSGRDFFNPTYEYEVGRKPNSVAVGDVNGDGRADIVTANAGSNDVSVLLGKKDGFEPAKSYKVDRKPNSVAVGDVNGDGRADIVTANEVGGFVSVLPGQAGGGFASAIYDKVGTNPRNVAVADVNRDGRPDIITANFGSDNVSVLWGRTKGDFVRTDYRVGDGPSSVGVVDVNGDGRPDIITSNVNSNDVSVLLGDTPPPLTITSQPPSSSVVCSGDNVQISVGIDGTVKAYQWYKDGKVIFKNHSATTATLRLDNVTPADAGRYTLIATNECASATSQPVDLTVNTTPAPPTLLTSSATNQLYPARQSRVTVPQYLTGPVSQVLNGNGPTILYVPGPVRLVVDGCPGGKISWQSTDGQSGTGSSISVSTNTVGTFVYTATCRQGSCTSEPAQATVQVVAAPLKVEAPLYDCERRQLALRTSGGNGEALQYRLVRVSGGSSSVLTSWQSSSTFVLDSRDVSYQFDLSLQVRQRTATGSYDEAALVFAPIKACGSGRIGIEDKPGAEPGTGLQVRVQENPVRGGELVVEVRGAQGEPLHYQLTDLSGRLLQERQLKQAGENERQRLPLGNSPVGVLLLRVNTPTQSQSVRVLRAD